MEEKEKKNETSIKTIIKQNIKIIVLIIIVVIIISLMNTNSNVTCKKMKGGIGQITASALSTISRLTQRCTTNVMEDGMHRFKEVTEHVLGVMIFILALILIPAFPIFIYVAAMYLIISQMFKGMRKI